MRFGRSEDLVYITINVGRKSWDWPVRSEVAVRDMRMLTLSIHLCSLRGETIRVDVKRVKVEEMLCIELHMKT